MKLTVIMLDPETETAKLVLDDPSKLAKFLAYLFHDLEQLEPNSAFTLTIEKDTTECKIQLIN